MRRRFKKASDEAGIDMTPMLDIVFILLIFFIVTATFVREKGVDLRPPPESDQPPPPDAPPIILVQIREDNTIFVNQQVTDIARVSARIERFRSEDPDSPVLIEPDPEADHGVVVRTWDAANEVGAKAVTINVTDFTGRG